jgi:hypothetical protein
MIGKGDFSFNPKIDCYMNSKAVTILSYVDICGATLCNILLLRFLIVRCIEHKSIFIFKWNSKSLFPLFFLIHGIGDFIFSILKVTTTNSSVGNDIPITIVAFSLAPIFFMGMVLYYMVILNFLKGYTRMMSSVSRDKVAKMFSLYEKLAWLTVPIAFSVGLLPAIGLKYSEYGMEFSMVYLIGGGITTLLFGILWLFIFGFLLKKLASHLKDSVGSMDDIKVVYLRLRAAYYVGSLLLAIIAAFYIIFGVWTFLRIRSDYVLLLIQITVHPTATVLVLTVSHISHSDQVSPEKIDKYNHNEVIANSSGHVMTPTPKASSIV